MTRETSPLASRWKRLSGALLDSLIAMVITLPAMMAAGVFDQIADGQPMTFGQQAFFFVFGLVVFLLINGYLLARYGQTVGKRVVGTRIVSHANGELLPLGHVFGLRYAPLSVIAQVPIFGNLFAVLDCLFIFRKDKRCIHDLIAGTRVIDA